jgi:hypothetical protein
MLIYGGDPANFGLNGPGLAKPMSMKIIISYQV